MTGWIVALVGLKFKVEALALPLVGLGVVLRLAATAGGAAPGLGAGRLRPAVPGHRDAAAGLRGWPSRCSCRRAPGLAVLAQLAVGALMTVLMQSSSAAMTVALTAAQGGLLDAQGAAAVVIGANIGTTVTALLAAMGATANARRAAAAHVVFNAAHRRGGAAAAALADRRHGHRCARRWNCRPTRRPKLALFHTVFNVLGVLLMWPLADR
jgi:phosphate:Na+ symporter